MYDWLTEIGESIRFQNLFIWVNFSFLMVKDETISYRFAAKALSIERFKLFDKEGWIDFTDRFKGKNEEDFFSQVFANKEDNPFQASGYRPYKLVCAYVWIRK